MSLLRLPPRVTRALATLLGVASVAGSAGSALAADIDADPATYRTLLPTLVAGDTLHLAAGSYLDHLPLSGLAGRSDAWITITGPETGAPAVVFADPGPCCNTVEIADTSYLALRRLTIDGNFVDGAFGLSAKDGAVHHIRVEHCTFLHHDTGQQNVAISTKLPTWGWEIRHNRISGAGTGLYLGNSDGSDPFIGGLIEHNLIEDTIGYNMQIKWQQPRPGVAGMPTGPSTTVIRHNVFIKNDRESPDGDRPNLLVGGFPDSGAGADDRYQIYGNLFVHNPRESLFQGEGRVSLHDNIFVDVAGAAIALQQNNLALRQAWIYHNTIYAAGTGIHLASTAAQGDFVVGNLVFAGTPISGSIVNQSDNIVGSVASAASQLTAPSLLLGAMDFYPLPGQCQGAAIDLTTVASDVDHDLDFNGIGKGAGTFRGAYAGAGSNPGWSLAAAIKGEVATRPDAGAADRGAADVTAGDRRGDAAAWDRFGLDATVPDVTPDDLVRLDSAVVDAGAGERGAAMDAGSAVDGQAKQKANADPGCSCRAVVAEQSMLVWLPLLAAWAWRRDTRFHRRRHGSKRCDGLC